MSFSALAVMSARDEADIIEWTVEHLVCQGVQVYVVDNWSTDGTWEMLPDLPLVGYERFPEDGPSKTFACRTLHKRIDELLAASDADACVFHDADEIRRSPRVGETLLDGFQRIFAGGFTAIDHKLYHFAPVDNDYAGDPERHFKYYEPHHVDSKNFHIKVWKNQHKPIGLDSWSFGGGHNVRFPGCWPCPERFVLKHYPIRSQSHGERKILDRLARWDPVERARGWHIQYDGMAPPHNFLKLPKDLKLWSNEDILVGTPLPRHVTILTLTRYPEIFRRLCCSLHRWNPLWVSKVVVVDGSTSLGYLGTGWKVVKGIEPFSFARNFNLGVAAADQSSDILFINDDAVFRDPCGIQKLSDIAYSDPGIGVLSPQVARGIIGNPLQHVRSGIKDLTFCDSFLAFVCIYIKRDVLDRVGLMDELTFDGYGSEDVDMCLRVRKAGYKLAVTPKVLVDHGIGTRGCSSSFLTMYTPGQVHASMLAMRDRLRGKWGAECL